MSDTLLYEAQTAQQTGRLGEAARLYHELLRTNPRHFEALYALGQLYFQSGQHEQAQYLLGEALKLDPLFVEGMCLKGVALASLKRYPAALAAFEQALAIKPDFVEALTNHAATLLEMGRHEEALAELDRALAIDPAHAIGLNNRGNALVALKRYGEAVACYDRALAINPEFPDAVRNRLYALGELNRGGPQFAGILFAQGVEAMQRERWGEAAGRFNEVLAIEPDFPEALDYQAAAMREANRRLFDDYAPNFENSLLNQLNYRGHLLLHELADRVWPEAKTALRILDLGCGTGLVGDLFKDWAAGGRLDGIDISPRMIEVARKRGIYDDLALGDLQQMLTEPGEIYDLILAGDTIVYFADLSRIFAGTAQRLRPGGFFIFMVESKDGEGWEQTPVLRFRHSESYLRRESDRAGFVFAGLTEFAIRLETGVPVAGFAVALQKPHLP